MSTPKVYAICGTNCRYETLTKEQILTAIANAVESGDIGDIDAGFITTIKEQNGGEGLRFWVGTMAAYNALTEIDADMLYIITDDTTLADIEQAYKEIKAALDNIENGITKVPKAKQADDATKATYAKYASEDTSKGTIEERLTNLGFKEGTVSISHGTATLNNIKKKGKYCILNLVVKAESGNLVVSPAQGYIFAKVPAEFIPKNDAQGYYARCEDSSGNHFFQEVVIYATSGSIKVVASSYYFVKIEIYNFGYDLG